jgi:hypothetical protein
MLSPALSAPPPGGSGVAGSDRARLSPKGSDASLQAFDSRHEPQGDDASEDGSDDGDGNDAIPCCGGKRCRCRGCGGLELSGSVVRREVGYLVAAAILFGASYGSEAVSVADDNLAHWLRLAAFAIALTVPARGLEFVVFSLINRLEFFSSTTHIVFWVGCLDGPLAHLVVVVVTWASFAADFTPAIGSTQYFTRIMAFLVVVFAAYAVRSLLLRASLSNVIQRSYAGKIADALSHLEGLRNLTHPLPDAIRRQHSQATRRSVSARARHALSGGVPGGPDHDTVARMLGKGIFREQLAYVKSARFLLYDPRGELAEVVRSDQLQRVARAAFKRLYLMSRSALQASAAEDVRHWEALHAEVQRSIAAKSAQRRGPHPRPRRDSGIGGAGLHAATGTASGAATGSAVSRQRAPSGGTAGAASGAGVHHGQGQVAPAAAEAPRSSTSSSGNSASAASAGTAPLASSASAPSEISQVTPPAAAAAPPPPVAAAPPASPAPSRERAASNSGDTAAVPGLRRLSMVEFIGSPAAESAGPAEHPAGDAGAAAAAAVFAPLPPPPDKYLELGHFPPDKYLELGHFRAQLGREAGERMFELADTNRDGRIFKAEWVAAFEAVFREWKALRKTLRGHQSVSRALQTIADLVYGVVCLLILLLVFEISVTAVFVPLATLLVSISFVRARHPRRGGGGGGGISAL